MMLKLLGVFGLLVTIGLVAVSPAVAAQPVHGTFDTTESGVDTDVCPGFAVAFTEHSYGFYDIYFDGAGNFLKFISHVNEDYVITANGKTLIERDNYKFTAYADGSSTNIGSPVHVQGSHGLVQRDAGRIVFNADGSITVNGPHPQFGGATWCSALAP
jgi:hypothetical protein